MKSSHIKILLASLSGNILEWYDFSIYGYFSSVLAKVFFPSVNGFVSFVLIFGIFASGFLIRPFGAALFGYIGDTRGRRTALIASIILTLVATTLIGVLPSYGRIGLLAPVLLTVLRLLQGLAVSGELTGSGIFTIESSPAKNRNLFSSLVMSSTYLGLLSGAGVVALLTLVFSPSEIQLFAWRIPFLCSSIFGLLALAFRINCSESPLFLKAGNRRSLIDRPVRYCVKVHPFKIIYVCLISSSLAVAIYLIIAYMPHFLREKGMSFREVMLVSCIGLLTLTISTPLFGHLANKTNKNKVLGGGACGFIMFSVPIFQIANQPGIIPSIVSEFLLAFFLAPIAGTLILILSEAFPTNLRYTGVSIGYNLSMTLFGGTTPLIALYLKETLGSNTAPAYYLVLSGILSLVGIWGLRNRKAGREGFPVG